MVWCGYPVDQDDFLNVFDEFSISSLILLKLWLTPDVLVPTVSLARFWNWFANPEIASSVKCFG